MLPETIETGLASFALSWVLSFWHKTEPVRERLGVYHIYDKTGEPTDRIDGGGLGGWINCPMCTAVATLPLAWLLRKPLAPLGIAIILTRWFEGARPKARWWV